MEDINVRKMYFNFVKLELESRLAYVAALRRNNYNVTRTHFEKCFEPDPDGITGPVVKIVESTTTLILFSEAEFNYRKSLAGVIQNATDIEIARDIYINKLADLIRKKSFDEIKRPPAQISPENEISSQINITAINQDERALLIKCVSIKAAERIRLQEQVNAWLKNNYEKLKAKTTITNDDLPIVLAVLSGLPREKQQEVLNAAVGY